MAVVYRVDSDEDALNAANDTDFGLVGYVFSKTQALAYAERLETGMVGVNRGGARLGPGWSIRRS